MVKFVESKKRADIRAIEYQLMDIANKEATKLYRLAWRMEAHGCKPESVKLCREEARWLQWCPNPSALIDTPWTWVYAFKY